MPKATLDALKANASVSVPEDPRIARWIDEVEPTRWASFILDGDFRLVWVSDELKAFLGEFDEGKLGYGLHVIEALFNGPWAQTISQESQVSLFTQGFPFLLSADREEREALVRRLDEPYASLVKDLQPVPMPQLWSNRFEYIGDEDLPSYNVDFVAAQLRDERGELVGIWVVTFMSIRPNLVSLLTRGNEEMYERMARLIEPSRKEAAILSADLEASGRLSRQLPTSAYFKLVRELTTVIDAVVAEHDGILGKHAGDGVTAFFLVEDCGSPSAAARAAIATARAVQRAAAGMEFLGNGGLEESACRVNVGLHWGGSLYMGQLVPGGRLDVTALGDEMNECARVQDVASEGQILASKNLLERLDALDAQALDVNPDAVHYRSLADFPDVAEKVIRDAGGLAVTAL